MKTQIKIEVRGNSVLLERTGKVSYFKDTYTFTQFSGYRLLYPSAMPRSIVPQLKRCVVLVELIRAILANHGQRCDVFHSFWEDTGAKGGFIGIPHTQEWLLKAIDQLSPETGKAVRLVCGQNLAVWMSTFINREEG